MTAEVIAYNAIDEALRVKITRENKVKYKILHLL
jgi:hypothetical protein